MTTEPVADPPLRAAADAFASEAHAGQIRNYNGRPYIQHPRAVATLLREAGYGEDVLAAALLHDVVEDTDTEARAIRERFGADVADLVDALTEDPSIASYEARKDAHRGQVISAGPDAIAIYSADKLSNVGDLRLLYGTEGEAVAERFKTPLDLRIALWRRDVGALEALSPPPPFVADLARELEALEETRAGILHNS
jgi:(p)ppGpp synthase/HD superfamily hydrolase